MRRLSFLLTTIGVIVLAVVIYDHTRQDRWRPLPGGGEIRFMTVTYGQIIRNSTGKSIFEPLRGKLGQRWSGLLGPKPLITGMTLAEPGLVIWFTTRDDAGNRDRQLDTTHFRLVSDTGQESYNWAYTTKDGGSRRLIGMVFESTARVRPRLHVRIVKDSQTLDLQFANPLYPAAKDLASESSSPVPVPADLPYAQAVPGKPGYVTSPFAPQAEAIDVRGYERGTKFHCPYTQNFFLVP